jgi:hypothetical protein
VAEKTIFVVHGVENVNRSAGDSPTLSRDVPGAVVKRSVQLSRQRASGGELALDAIDDEDLVVLHLENGPTLVLNPQHARELFEAQAVKGTKRSGGPEQSVPLQLRWSALRPGEAPMDVQRGLVSDVVLSAIDIVTGKFKKDAAGWAASAVVAKVDGQVRPGLYQLDRTRFTESLKESGALPVSPESAEETILVLIHGTFSNTYGTFHHLWDKNPEVLDKIFAYYGNRVYGLEHETLGASPIENALALVEAMPQGASLALLTHSRGGLVAEVLARVCSYKFAGEAALDQELDGAFSGASYAAERANLRALILAARKKAIRIERVVRVACPARGTLLASSRLDAYISIVKWAMELGSVPVLPELLEFLGAVAQHKADPVEIPGLAAQIPDSPLIGWLHAVDQPVDGELRVVAGDIQGDSLGSWIKTLASDSFYWTDNDFVVQTSSMYGGAPRAAGASFVLERHGKVSHFAYFSLPTTAQAVCNGLTQTEPHGFRPIGPLSWSGQSSEGYRAGQGSGDRPVVFVLPGILGSNLKVNDDRVWLGWRMLNGMGKLRYEEGDTRVQPDGPIALSYAKLIRFLSATHDVIEFSYDWRKPIEQEAQRLAAAVERELDRREGSGQPVRLMAHSMGGLLVRTMILESEKTWLRLQSRAGSRFVMLGTPNGGSWAPMQVLSGDDTFGNVLVAFSAPFSDGKARAIMAQFPGFLQLQAGLLDHSLELQKSDTWRKLAREDKALVDANTFWHRHYLQLQSFEWGVPGDAVLAQAAALRRRLDEQAANFRDYAGTVALVVGRADFTPDGYAFDEGGLKYREAADAGDGRVTLTSALLPGVPVWSIDCEHGSLADKEDGFDAYLELLQTGSTSRLPRLAAPAARDGEADVKPRYRLRRASRIASGVRPDDAGRMAADVGGGTTSSAERVPALEVRVVNGNLKFVQQPVLVGHYTSHALTGSEKVLDRLIGGNMSKAIVMGCYPNALYTHQIFSNIKPNEDNPLQLPRPESVIVVGLGGEGALKAPQLADAVCHGVVAWAQRLLEVRVGDANSFEIAATLMGSGGANITAGIAARAIAQGVSRANKKLREAGWPVVRQLNLVELYADRALEAWNAVKLLAGAEPGCYRIFGEILNGTGPQRRALDSTYRGAGYDLISALSDDAKPGTIIYSLNTRRAREDVRAQRTQLPLIKMLVTTAATAANTGSPLGRTLFQLLVPPEVEPFLSGSTDMQIELDSGSSGIPWELLDTSGQGRVPDESEPWAIRCKLLRRLRTADTPLTVNDAGSDAHFLVIGEPICDAAYYPPLPGARMEAAIVADTLAAAGYGRQVRRLISGEDGVPPIDASHVINTLLERDWRVLHIAGHGAPNEGNKERGVVLSNDSYLGPVELSNMRTVPALVFVNCCHLGAQAPGALLRGSGLRAEDRPQFAASVAEALIRRGVRCVLVAGWAVDDGAAAEFAKEFYRRLVAGDRFIDAVAAARMVARSKGGNTWAAYQCYGDPDWRLVPIKDGAQQVQTPAEEFASVASALALVLALEMIVTAARYEDVPLEQTLKRVAYLEAEFGARWRGIGEVAEAFSQAWSHASRLDKAISWARLARDAGDGSASLRALEQLGSLLARAAWERVRPVWAVYAVSRSDTDMHALRAAVQAEQACLDESIELLSALVKLQPTMERLALLGASCKRKAMFEGATATECKASLQQMQRHYLAAELIGRKAGAHWFYPGINRLLAQLVSTGTGQQESWDEDTAGELEIALAHFIRTEPDFWSVACVTELKLYAAIAGQRLAGVEQQVIAEFKDLQARVRAVRQWNSILDQFDFLAVCLPPPDGAEERAAFDRVRSVLLAFTSA